MYRSAYEELLEWKNSKDRKPLILEGVRQCGKTFLLKEFGKNNYKNVVYLNFEDDNRLADIFEHDLDIERILSRIAMLSGDKIEPGNTFLIMDEIQFCGRALTSLKYFCENAPEYHIACAGSLLGVLMSRPYSFPVGKVDRIRMGPMTFKEFLLASGKTNFVNKMDELIPPDDFISPFTSTLEHHLRTYLTVGGMPAAVDSWIKEKDINKVNKILDNILKDYIGDFSKHATESIQKLTLIWKSVPAQLAKENKKFIFGHVKTGARARDLEDALEWLINAGLLHKVRITDPSRLPLSISADNSCFKIYVTDIGILRRMSELDSMFDSNSNDGLELYRGAVVENYVLNELIAATGRVPFYWRSAGTAEVDFIIQHNNEAVPIEVKSGRRIASQSMSEYIRRYEPRIAVITSFEMGDGDIVKKIPLCWLWRLEATLEKENL